MLIRTDADRIQHRPTQLVIGGRTLEVRPLVIKKSAAWKALLFAAYDEFARVDVSFENAEGKFSLESAKAGLEAIANALPQKVNEIIVAYLQAAGVETDLDTFEAEATDQEAVDAFFELIQVTFPLLRRAGDLTRLMQATR